MTATTATALMTSAIAVLVAAITFGQWRTNRARLRHELFDRRYEVYEQIAAFIAEILQSGHVPPGEPEAFLRRTKKAYFLFACDPKIKALVSDIYRNAAELHAHDAALDTQRGDERSRSIESQRVIKNWFQDTLGSMETKFEKYLNLQH